MNFEAFSIRFSSDFETITAKSAVFQSVKRGGKPFLKEFSPLPAPKRQALSLFENPP